jgi:hypothetical protein
MGAIGPGLITIVGGIIGLAIVAVLVSQKAQTSGVVQAGGTALSQIIGAAVAPVSQNNNFGSAGGTG